MKHKTSELSGALLDAAVAKAEGISGLVDHNGRMCREQECDPEAPAWDHDLDAWKSWFDYAPSQAWSDGGPIIERERINLYAPLCVGDYEEWEARVAAAADGQRGSTSLIAAMRAYVASKFGDEVELP